MKDFYSHSDDVVDIEDEETEENILERIEIVVKSAKLDLKDALVHFAKISDSLPTIKDLKDEIKELKRQLEEEKKFNRELIIKFVEKPAAPSAVASYYANKAQQEEKSKGGFAAIDKAANKN